ncbi:MAG: RNA-binding protein [Myxococcota bacterium]
MGSKEWTPLDVSDGQRRSLRGTAHSLKAVVQVGKGDITAGVIAAVDEALSTHELVKVKLLKACTVDKSEAAETLAEGTGAALIQRVGRVTVLYRPRPDDPA